MILYGKIQYFGPVTKGLTLIFFVSLSFKQITHLRKAGDAMRAIIKESTRYELDSSRWKVSKKSLGPLLGSSTFGAVVRVG